MGGTLIKRGVSGSPHLRRRDYLRVEGSIDFVQSDKSP